MRLGLLLSFIGLFFTVSMAGDAQEEAASMDAAVTSFMLMDQETLREKLADGPTDADRASLLITLILKEYDAGEEDLAIARSRPFLNWLADTKNSKFIHGASDVLRLAMRDRESSAYPDIMKEALLPRLAAGDKKLFVILSTDVAIDLYRYSKFDAMYDVFQPALPIMKHWQSANAADMREITVAWHQYGQVLVRKNRVSEAIEVFFKIEELYGAFPEGKDHLYSVDIVIGEAFLSVGNNARAEEFLKKGLEGFPQDRIDARGFALAKLASSLHRQDKLDEALVVLESYAEYPQDDRPDYQYQFKNIYGDVLSDLGRFEEAKGLAEEALGYAVELNDFDYAHDSMHKLGFLTGVTGDYAKGERLILSSLKAHVQTRSYNLPGAYQSLARLKTFHGEFKEALEAFRQFKVADDILKQMHNTSVIAELDSARSLQAAERERDMLIAEREKNLLEQSLNEQTQQAAFRQYMLGFVFLLLALVAFSIGRRIKR